MSAYETSSILPWITACCTGFLLDVAAHLVIAFYSPTLRETAPRSAWLFSGSALLLSQVLDNMDGKQARRIGASSPLGMVIDHGTDAVNLSLSAVNVCAALQWGGTWPTFVSLVFSASVFYIATWEEFYTGTLTMGVINGANEGMLVAALVMLFNGVVGPEVYPGWWATNVTRLAGFDVTRAHLVLIGTVPICALTILSYIWSVVMTERGKKSRYDSESRNGRSRRGDEAGDDKDPKSHKASHYGNKRPRVRDAMATAVPFLIAGALCCLWDRSSPNDVFKTHPRAALLTCGFIFAKLVTQLNVCHVAGMPYYPWRKTFLIPLVLVSANTCLPRLLSASPHTPFLDEVVLMHACLVISFVGWVHLAVGVTREMSAILKVPVFSLPESVKRANRKTQ